MTAAGITRPFHFIVVMWGARFRAYFTDWCLPTLLSPGNLPALPRGLAHKFLIATTRDDWAALERHPIFRRLAEYVEPVLVEIEAAPPGVSGCDHMGLGHKLCTAIAFRERAYGFLLTPDFMLTEGAVARLVEHASAGCQVVMSAALRFGEEPLFAGLRARGLFAAGRDPGAVQPLPPRLAAGACLEAFHSETVRYEYELPCFSDFPVAAIWRVAGEQAAVVHSLSWAPVLLDYGTLSDHDDSTMDGWTIDGDYVHKNFADAKSVHVVRDSDEMLVVSWAPLDDRPQDLSAQTFKGPGALGCWYRRNLLRAAFESPVFDPFKRAIFPQAVVWHAEEPSAAVIARIQHAKAEISVALTAGPASRAAFAVLNRTRSLGRVAFYVVRRAIELPLKAALGDVEARQRIARRLSLVLNGRPLAP